MKAKVITGVTDTRGNVFGPRIFREFTITFAPAVSHLGLQKKFYRTGQLPPGWQKKMRPFPYEVEQRLPPPPNGCARGYMNGFAVVYQPHTGVIVDIHAVFGR